MKQTHVRPARRATSKRVIVPKSVTSVIGAENASGVSMVIAVIARIISRESNKNTKP